MLMRLQPRNTMSDLMLLHCGRMREDLPVSTPAGTEYHQTQQTKQILEWRSPAIARNFRNGYGALYFVTHQKVYFRA